MLSTLLLSAVTLSGFPPVLASHCTSTGQGCEHDDEVSLLQLLPGEIRTLSNQESKLASGTSVERVAPHDADVNRSMTGTELSASSSSATDEDPKQAMHKWPCKNGDLHRSGASQHVGPKDLTKPIWEWAVPGHTAKSGHIEATPLIDSNDNIFIGTTTGGIFALRRDGTELWHRSENPTARVMTGALYGDSLYTATNEGVALCLDLGTGKQNWRKKYSKMAGDDAWSVTATSGLVVVPGAKYSSATGNEFIVAMSANDGSKKWTYKPKVNVYNFMPAISNGKLIFIDFKGDMYCLLLSSGKLQWKTNGDGQSTDGFRFTTAGVAIGSTGLAYTNFNTMGASTGVLKAYEIEKGTERWSQHFPHEASAAPVVGRLGLDGRVGVVVGLGHNAGFNKGKPSDVQGFIKAFDADTGAEMWTFTTPHRMLNGSAGVNSTPGEDSVPDTFSNAIIGKDGTVYVGWEGGNQYALDGATGKMISSHFNGWGQQGEAALSSGFVVFPTTGKVLAFAEPTEAVTSQESNALMMCQLRWSTLIIALIGFLRSTSLTI